MNESDARRAERTLLNQTRHLSESELTTFLDQMGVPRQEYDDLLVKYRHLLEAYNKLEIES
jgi:hypothetical protein